MLASQARELRKDAAEAAGSGEIPAPDGRPAKYVYVRPDALGEVLGRLIRKFGPGRTQELPELHNAGRIYFQRTVILSLPTTRDPYGCIHW